MTPQAHYWYRIEPVDTLFFRGAEGMEAGEHHEVDTLFPPLPETICGAVRTAVLAQNGVEPGSFLDRPEEYAHLPLLGKPDAPGFTVTGPLFAVAGQALLPAPAHWFVDKRALKAAADGDRVLVEPARPLAAADFGLAGGAVRPFWVHRPRGRDLVPLAGRWITGAALASARDGGKFELVVRRLAEDLSPDEPAVLDAAALFRREPRTGIALTGQRVVRQGHLYSTTHIRLQDGVALLFAIDRNPEGCLAASGILQLGGEQRICRYERMPDVILPATGGSCRLALCPVPTELVPDDVPRAVGRIFRVGGWNMQTRFHKPMRGYFPAGSVFAAELEDQRFIAI